MSIKAADPNATVLGGVLISIATRPPYYVNPTQAEYIEDYLNAWSQIPYAGPSFFYETRDQDTDSGWVDYTFGVLRDDWTLKPSAYSITLWAATHPHLASLEVLL